MAKKKIKKEKEETEKELGEKTEEVNEVVNDRSAFNCKPCGGSGLLKNGSICFTCKGRGKV